MNKKEQIFNILRQLSIIFDYTLDEPKAELYIRLLQDESVDALQAAAYKQMRQGKRFPLPSELLELAAQS